MPKNLQILGVCMLTMGINGAAGETEATEKPALKLDFFPVTTQFSPVPAGPGWKGDPGLPKGAHFTLWQLPSQINSIGMSYVLRTAGGQVLVIDGGWEQESGYLRGFLAALGNTVPAWFITHPHVDHAGALLDILKKPGDLKIKTLYQTSLDPCWYRAVEPEAMAFCDRYYAGVRESGVHTVEVELGMTIVVDGVT
jgi:glyoxylase-like metal-dependent hydrolase (beta-lactamase superfamily II)